MANVLQYHKTACVLCECVRKYTIHNLVIGDGINRKIVHSCWKKINRYQRKISILCLCLCHGNVHFVCELCVCLRRGSNFALARVVSIQKRSKSKIISLVYIWSYMKERRGGKSSSSLTRFLRCPSSFHQSNWSRRRRVRRGLNSETKRKTRY